MRRVLLLAAALLMMGACSDNADAGWLRWRKCHKPKIMHCRPIVCRPVVHCRPMCKPCCYKPKPCHKKPCKPKPPHHPAPVADAPA